LGAAHGSLSQGSVIICQGLDHRMPLDMAYLDWQMTMPYPTVDGSKITAANGYRIEFLELGRQARITYESADAAFDITQTAVTPLVARGAVIPGENLHASHDPGGSEQFMHCTGELRLRGETYAVDCYMPRDRSWRQSRTEERGGRHDPPVAWTPIYFPDNPPIPSWPNAFTWDSVIRWTDDAGRIGYGPCQGIWYDAFQRLMKDRRS
jgi:hypothetical protein